MIMENIARGMIDALPGTAVQSAVNTLAFHTDTKYLNTTYLN
jgi:hypothetical protein